MDLCPFVILVPVACYLYANGLNTAANRILFLLLMLGLGAFVSMFIPAREAAYPLPHQIPKYPDGISLRLAMVHDVLHDRYPRHGQAYYRERNRQILAQLARAEKDADDLPPPDQYPLLDDLGVGYDALGQPAEGARVLRAKLKGQLARGMKGRELYTTYANLGTFLIHANLAQARRGAPAATAEVREGLAFLCKSIEVNPEAHFGREVWQAVAAEFSLATAAKPELLLKYDMVGNRLDHRSYFRSARMSAEYTIPGRRNLSALFAADEPAYKQIARCARNSADGDCARLREYITRVGAEGDWAEDVSFWCREPVPFDEPVLGIIGMWRLGGGANPHFALALGEIMLRIGQNQLAWCAYERAIRESERFSSDSKVRAAFVAHCETRQQHLQRGERAQFEAELQHGQQYQQAYQRYEEEQIAAGRSLDDPHFHDAFHAAHPPIATPVADADFMEASEPALAATPILAGFFCLIGGLILRWRGQTDPRQAKSNPA